MAHPLREKTFYRGIFVYTIGNFGTKIVNTLIFPLLSFYILPAQMGLLDMSIVYIYLLIPILSLNVKDSAIRFLMSEEHQQDHGYIILFCLKKLMNGILYSALIAIILQSFFSIPFLWWIYLAFISTLAFEIIVQIVRGSGHVKIFAFGHILFSIVFAISSIIFVKVLGMDIRGIFLGHIFAKIVSIFVLEMKVKFLQKALKNKKILPDLRKEMLHYSVTFIPNIVLFQIIEHSSKLFISQFLGLDQNGLFAIVIKFSSILLSLANIFYQTWQELAIKFYNSEDRNNFFTNVFNHYLFGLSLLAIIIGFGAKLIFPYVVGIHYRPGVIYIYPLLISVLFSAIALFLDMIYQCSKQSQKSLPSIIATAILAIVLNYFLVKNYGILGGIYAMISSYAFLSIFRLIDSHHIVPIRIKRKSVLAIVILIVGWYINVTMSNQWLFLLITASASVLFLYLYGIGAVRYLKGRRQEV